MPDPEDFRFHTPGPRSPPVRAPLRVGEEVELRLSPFAQLELRVQALERAIACGPFAFYSYDQELKRVGLKKLDLKP